MPLIVLKVSTFILKLSKLWWNHAKVKVSWKVQEFSINTYSLALQNALILKSIPKDSSKPDGDTVENGALLFTSSMHVVTSSIPHQTQHLSLSPRPRKLIMIWSTKHTNHQSVAMHWTMRHQSTYIPVMGKRLQVRLSLAMNEYFTLPHLFRSDSSYSDRNFWNFWNPVEFFCM